MGVERCVFPISFRHRRIRGDGRCGGRSCGSPIRGGCFLRDRNSGVATVVMTRAVRRSLLRLASAEFADAVRVALIERKAACRVGGVGYREAERGGRRNEPPARPRLSASRYPTPPPRPAAFRSTSATLSASANSAAMRRKSDRLTARTTTTAVIPGFRSRRKQPPRIGTIPRCSHEPMEAIRSLSAAPKSRALGLAQTPRMVV